MSLMLFQMQRERIVSPAASVHVRNASELARPVERHAVEKAQRVAVNVDGPRAQQASRHVGSFSFGAFSMRSYVGASDRRAGAQRSGNVRSRSPRSKRVGWKRLWPRGSPTTSAADHESRTWTCFAVRRGRFGARQPRFRARIAYHRFHLPPRDRRATGAGEAAFEVLSAPAERGVLVLRKRRSSSRSSTRHARPVLGLHQDVMRTKKIAKFRELLSGKVIEAFPSVDEYGKGEVLLVRAKTCGDRVFFFGNPKRHVPRPAGVRRTP